MKKPVTERAMMARINRKLAKDGGHKLLKTRGRLVSELGLYHIVDEVQGVITDHHIDDLEPLAEELGVLKPFEEVVCEE